MIFRHEERFKECSFGLALFRSREIDLSDIRKHWAKLTSTAALITVEITAISASVIELAKFICVSRIFLFFNHFTAEALSCIQLLISDILIRRLCMCALRARFTVAVSSTAISRMVKKGIISFRNIAIGVPSNRRSIFSVGWFGQQMRGSLPLTPHKELQCYSKGGILVAFDEGKVVREEASSHQTQNRSEFDALQVPFFQEWLWKNGSARN